MNKMKKGSQINYRNALIFLVAVLFIFSAPQKNFALISKPSQIAIPETYGWVSEYQKANSQNPANNPIIINIKEAHCSYSAQKNIYFILSQLIQSQGVKLIGIEGGFGYCGLSYLRKSSAKDKRIKVAEEFLKSGKISGAEYFDLVSDKQITLWGIEDETLYAENIQSFQDIQAVQKELNRGLDNICSIIDKLKPKVYPNELLEFEAKEKAYISGEISTEEIIKMLTETAGKNNLAMAEFKSVSEQDRVSKKIDSTLDDFKREIASKNSEVSSLFMISQAVDLLTKLTNIQLSPREFKKLRIMLGYINKGRQAEDSIIELVKKYKIFTTASINFDNVKQNIAKMMRFYQVAAKRDRAFFNNITFKMQREKLKIACIITGGYHSEHLSKLFTQTGYDYVSIVPRINDDFNPSHYFTVLKEKFQEWVR